MARKKADPAAVYPSTEGVLSTHGQAMPLGEAIRMIVRRNPRLRLFGRGMEISGGSHPIQALSVTGPAGEQGGNAPAVIAFDLPDDPNGYPWAFEGLLKAGNTVWAIGPRLGIAARTATEGEQGCASA